MIFDFVNYRQFLKQVVVDRQSRNARYSLKSLARHLDLAPSTLSEVMSSKKNFSSEMAAKVAFRLGLKNSEADYFCLLVQMEAAKSEEVKATFQQRLQNLNPRRSVQSLDVDAFKVMSEWYHLAVLGALHIDGFEFNPENLSRSFGITRLEAETAVDRLLRLKLIERDERGKFKRAVSDLFVNTPVSNKSVNSYFRQMLQKAMDAVEDQAPGKERIMRTENIAIDERQLKEADAIIEEFFTKMAALTKKANRRTKLYHLGSQFFCLTRSGGKKS